ncbi:MAG: hypothetical protein CO042_03085 [Parcubacteria group bacterium CG_4_9_14_0_2_um_filter_41_8]|nr:MAG: hypothetical protein AUJ34_03560 [Parcubacteria group bacterium CG1_02_41_12]PIP66929.1 MAG: hypothetical protein COW93_02980 [Parcubacteria group bacterium CG22_combo_CG10-13_8_21_14_all_41_9]PIQ80348.1 MAG: hypothetical protein COV79_00970 [Parcubacteria group bacterium CG11_big_fil_rev_8_21_14_0_20_41_14]PIR56801.1 MAG: hypothetical protein COU72_04310 [Parcubacteria group bacterium CG10_big_fil_rev_8_21_14_0_10_41_35]PJC40572.1 MAG: hypothetical protein CO042_03085 [Parcubacteria gr
MKIIGQTNDAWAKELIEHIPKNHKKIIILVSFFAQILLTVPAKIFRFKTIWIISHNERGKIMAMLIKITSAFSDAIIAANQSTEARYLRMEIDSKKIQIIYPPCESNTESMPNKGRTTISCDGQIAIDQGMGLLLHAMASVRQIIPNIKLIIGGQIADPQKIQWIIKQLKLENIAQIAPTDKKTWMSQAHIYILPTEKDEPPPCSLAQAMMLSKAIIATDTLSNREFITQNKNGILIKQNNVDMLSQAIINLARKPNWMEQLGQNNRTFAEKKFSKEVFEEKLNNILN